MLTGLTPAAFKHVSTALYRHRPYTSQSRQQLYSLGPLCKPLRLGKKKARRKKPFPVSNPTNIVLMCNWKFIGMRGHAQPVMAPTAFSSKVRYIANQLYQNCVVPDSGDRVQHTGSVSPRGTLRYRASREAFDWAGSVHERRYFTKTAVRGALCKLLDEYSVQVPLCEGHQGLTRAEWLRAQTSRVQHLCKRSVKNSSARVIVSARAAMDNEDTQVVQAGAINSEHVVPFKDLLRYQDPWWIRTPPPKASDRSPLGGYPKVRLLHVQGNSRCTG